MSLTGTQLYHMIAQKQALRLEIKGLKHSRGSVYVHIKRTYGLRGGRKSVLAQFTTLIDELTSLNDKEPTP